MAVTGDIIILPNGSGGGGSGLQASNNLSDVASAATSRTNLGLGNVDNTSDVNKPISTLTQAALDLKQNLATPLTQISSLGTAANDDIIQKKAGVFTNRTIAQLATDLSSGGLATQTYVDNALYGLKWKTSVLVRSTANLTLSGEQTIDGVLTSASRVLVMNQSTASQNGIYVTSSGAWSRAVDADSSAELVNATCMVEQGTTWADTLWTCTTNSPITIGSTSIAFAQIGAVGTTSWGGITGTLSNQTDLNSALSGKEPTISAGTTSQYYRGDKSFQTLDKTAVGLSNVDNTSDATKNSATATLQNKTLDNTNIATIKASNLSIQDQTDTTKVAKFDASGISTATTRSFTLPNSNGTLALFTDITKANVGLSAVENTALSTWAGSTNITTLGTISSGTWSGTAIATSKGGTGQTSLQATNNASELVQRDSNKLVYYNGAVLPVTSTATAGGTTTLSISSNTIQIFTGSTTQTVKLPLLTGLSVGYMMEIINQSTGALTIQTNGASAITTIPAGQTAFFTANAIGADTAANWTYGFTSNSSLGTLATKSTIKTTITHTFTVNGAVAVPSGDTDFIIPMTIAVPTNQVVTLIGARAVINSGTSVTCKLQKGTTIAGLADITGYTALSVTTTLGTVGSGSTTFSDNDLLALVVTAVSGTPKNMMFSVKLEYQAVAS